MKQREQRVRIPIDGEALRGDLVVPDHAPGVVLFAHGSGSGRHSPRNRYVAGVLQEAGLGTLLIDLLTEREEAIDLRTTELRFDIDLLAQRLEAATGWLPTHPQTRDLAIGYFGASTGTAAALVAASRHPQAVRAIVSRGGRPDLAGAALARVRAPVLLIVGGNDGPVIALNEEALAMLPAVKRLEIIPGATHLFEEKGALERVAELAAGWFVEHLTGSPSPMAMP